ncbi:hypothetical protein [Nostoc sp. ChiQUE01b]|nr:hypothetical protein [Nostoc sp. ChiQUE01b]MDZ8262318.1 hypothetical protein [Nostoc sp. ChiQUE01b]
MKIKEGAKQATLHTLRYINAYRCNKLKQLAIASPSQQKKQRLLNLDYV